MAKMNKETADLFGITGREKLNPTNSVLLCKLIARMSEHGADDDFLYEILVSALTEENGKLIDFLERWLKKDSSESRKFLSDDIRQAIIWNRTVSISIDDLKPKSEIIVSNLMPFKKALSEKIKQNYPNGIPGLIKDMKLNKASFYRFLSEERTPNEDMFLQIQKIFRKLGIATLSFVKINPFSQIPHVSGGSNDEV